LEEKKRGQLDHESTSKREKKVEKFPTVARSRGVGCERGVLRGERVKGKDSQEYELKGGKPMKNSRGG